VSVPEDGTSAGPSQGYRQEFESNLIGYPFAFADRVSGGEINGLFLNEASAHARREIISVLASWSGMVAEERRLTTSPAAIFAQPMCPDSRGAPGQVRSFLGL
jgi:hypothetical protein